MTNLDSILKNKRHYFADKGSSSQSYGFSSSQVCMWKLSTEKLMVLNCSAGEDSSESCSPRTARRANQLILKEISPEYSLEGLMLKLKLQYFGHLMRRADSLKDPDAGKEWRWEEKGTTEDKMVGWHHWLDGHESEQALGAGDGQGGLACCSPWSCEDSDTTERLTDWCLIQRVCFFRYKAVSTTAG